MTKKRVLRCWFCHESIGQRPWKFLYTNVMPLPIVHIQCPVHK